MPDDVDKGPEALLRRTVSRRGFLGTGAFLSAGALAAPLLAACAASSDGTSSGNPLSGASGDASGGIGQPVTAFPAKLWNPDARPAGQRPDLPKRTAWQNIAAGVTALDTVDTWMRTAAQEIKYDYLSQNSNLIGRWGDGLSIPQFLEYQSFLIDSPGAAVRWEGDQDKCPQLYDDFLGGDTTYVAGRGEISYETRGAIYQGDLPVKLPDLQR